jgi:hypothetical protein
MVAIATGLLLISSPVNATVLYGEINKHICVPTVKPPIINDQYLVIQDLMGTCEISTSPTSSVLGLRVNYSDGRIEKVYVGSDLYGVVHTGDIIITINNHPYNPGTWMIDSDGEPGSQVSLAIYHRSRLINVVSIRKLASEYAP